MLLKVGSHLIQAGARRTARPRSRRTWNHRSPPVSGGIPNPCWNPPTITFPMEGPVFWSTDPHVPTSGGPYYWVTTNDGVLHRDHRIDRRPRPPREGAPLQQGEGTSSRRGRTRYWFDWSRRSEDSHGVERVQFYGPPMEVQMSSCWLYPTRVEDRFGNSVTYVFEQS